MKLFTLGGYDGIAVSNELLVLVVVGVATDDGATVMLVTMLQ